MPSRAAHIGIKAVIREQTYEFLKERIEHYRREAERADRPMANMRHAPLTSILHELHSCPEAARAWTGNWNMGDAYAHTNCHG